MFMNWFSIQIIFRLITAVIITSRKGHEYVKLRIRAMWDILPAVFL